MSRARDIADLSSVSARLDTLGASEGALSNRNLVINGNFQIFQRTSATTTVSNSNYQTADRWRLFESTDGAYTTERSTDTPSGTGYSLKAVVTTADTSIAATQYASIEQYIEAQNCQHLAYGTSSAKTITLSFFVKSNKTGTYTIALYKSDTTGYIFTKEYTIDSANTWEKKTITITPTAGSTSFITSSGGAIVNDTGIGLALGFNLAWGSNFTGGTSGSWSSTVANYSTTNAVNWMDTVGNTFLISEVQLEVGDTATDFEHRSYGDELFRCYRYYYSFITDNQNGLTVMHQDRLTDGYIGSINMPTQMRVAPTVTHTGMDRAHKPGVRYDTLSAGPGFSFLHSQGITFTITTTNSDVDSQTLYLGASSGGTINVDAEL